MRTQSKALLVMILLALPAVGALAAEPAVDADRLAVQTRLESGDDLSSRGRRVLFRAHTQQDAGDFQGAADLVTQWLTGDPGREHHLLRFNLALSFLELQRPTVALANLEKAVAREPRFARGWLRLGEAAYELQKYKRAGEAFAKAYDLSPERRPEILYYAGVSRLSGGEAPAAVADLTRLLDAHAEVAEVAWYQALCAAATEANQPGRAVPYLDQLLRAKPDDQAGWDLAYRFYAGQSDYETAATMLTVADYLNSLGRDESEQLGDLYGAIGVPLQAARYYERAFGGGAEPGPDEYRKWATAWLSAHETDKAREVIRQALGAKPTPKLWALLGDLEYTVEDYAAALAAFRSATDLDAEFGRGYLMMGYCALALGQDEVARGNLTQATKFADQAATARGLLAGLGEAGSK